MQDAVVVEDLIELVSIANKNQKRRRKQLMIIVYVGSCKQVSDFEITFKFILNYVKKTYQRGNDISASLRELKKTDTNVW